jgi:hypothetical protein
MQLTERVSAFAAFEENTRTARTAKFAKNFFISDLLD